MTRVPDTRQTLIQRIKDESDDAAWGEFVTIYRPAVLRFVLRRGLQLADAEDVTQRVFVSVARSMKDWEADRSRGSFRAWLLTVTRNAVINCVSREARNRSTGGTSTLRRLQELPEVGSLEEELQREYQRAEFRKAAADVECEFEVGTWQAFWRTAVNNENVADVAKGLGKSPGSVYAARSRVIRRIRQRVEQLQRATTGQAGK